MKRSNLFLLGIVAILSLTGCSGGADTTSESGDLDELPLELDKATDYVYDNNVSNENGSMSYEIFVRSFYDSNNDGIGDLNGVKAKIPYLSDLGIKTVWLMPINPSPSYHGYDITNYYDIEPDYGTLADFDALVAEANRYNIDIMIDMVLNHCSINHAWFQESYQDYLNNNESADSKKDWFVWGEGQHYYNGVLYESRFDASMPEFNLDNQAVRDEIENISKFWINHGVKGFRLDAVLYYYYSNTTKNVSFLTWLEETCHKYDPNFYMVGECWQSDVIVNQYHASKCDSFFRFGQAQGGEMTIFNFVKGYLNGATFATSIEKNETTIKSRNPDGYSSYFLSNHDQDRCSKNLDEDQNKLAMSFYGLLPGTPYMYYGEEIQLKGVRKTSPEDYSDARRRLPMIWSKNDKTGECAFPESNRQDLNNNDQVEDGVYDKLNENFSLIKHYKKIINIRNKYPFIKNSKFSSLMPSIDIDERSLMVYKLSLGDDYIIVVHNFAYYNMEFDINASEILDEVSIDHKISNLKDGKLRISSHSTVILH